jgi:hypothetical protein
VPAQSVLRAAAVGVARAQLDGAHGRETHGFSGLVVPLDRVVRVSEARAASLLEHVSPATEGTQDDRVGAGGPLAPHEEPVAFAGVAVDFVLLRVVALQLVVNRGPPRQLRLGEITLDSGRCGNASITRISGAVFAPCAHRVRRGRASSCSVSSPRANGASGTSRVVFTAAF